MLRTFLHRKSLWLPLALSVVMVCLLSLGAAPAASASPAHTLHAATQQHAAQVLPGCNSGQHRVVYLKNTVFAYSDSWCEDNTTQDCVNGSVTYDSWVCLFQDSQYGGQTISFNGVGCVNLTQFAGPGPTGTWNDAMSSFQTRQGLHDPETGAFWWDVNDSGYYYLFGPGWTTSTRWIGSTWNDQASSLNLNGLGDIKLSGC